MKRTVLLLTLATLAAGCANMAPNDGFFSQKCNRHVDGISPSPLTVITYGEKNKKKILEVKTKSKVKANTEFHLRLKTQNNSQYGVNYDSHMVTVTGVSTKGSVTGSNASWIGGSGTYSGLAGHILIAGCVPENAQVGEFYLFNVTVDNLGELDPRAEVVN